METWHFGTYKEREYGFLVWRWWENKWGMGWEWCGKIGGMIVASPQFQPLWKKFATIKIPTTRTKLINPNFGGGQFFYNRLFSVESSFILVKFEIKKSVTLKTFEALKELETKWPSHVLSIFLWNYLIITCWRSNKSIIFFSEILWRRGNGVKKYKW